jgi:hypothetical protein
VQETFKVTQGSQPRCTDLSLLWLVIDMSQTYLDVGGDRNEGGGRGEGDGWNTQQRTMKCEFKFRQLVSKKTRWSTLHVLLLIGDSTFRHFCAGRRANGRIPFVNKRTSGSKGPDHDPRAPSRVLRVIQVTSVGYSSAAMISGHFHAAETGASCLSSCAFSAVSVYRTKPTSTQ